MILLKVIYNNNMVSGILSNSYESPESAGIICTFKSTTITFSGYSFTTFINNKAMRGGAAVFF